LFGPFTQTSTCPPATDSPAVVAFEPDALLEVYEFSCPLTLLEEAKALADCDPLALDIASALSPRSIPVDMDKRVRVHFSL
jgi:hypothetical protein